MRRSDVYDQKPKSKSTTGHSGTDANQWDISTKTKRDQDGYSTYGRKETGLF